MRELRPSDRAAARVADHRGKIADDEDRFVSEVLKLAQLSQDDGVAEMQIGARRIDAELDPQRPA